MVPGLLGLWAADNAFGFNKHLPDSIHCAKVYQQEANPRPS